MMDAGHSLALVLVMAGMTALLRFLPFGLFSKKTPKPVLYLGEVLPPAVMAMLVVYCLKNTSFLAAPYGIPEIISILLVVALHKWKHNTLLSIVAGTACYMIMVQILL